MPVCHVSPAANVFSWHISPHTVVWYLMFRFCLASRATDETDLLSLWTNHGNQSFPRQRLFICEVCKCFNFPFFFLFPPLKSKVKVWCTGSLDPADFILDDPDPDVSTCCGHRGSGFWTTGMFLVMWPALVSSTPKCLLDACSTCLC